MSFTLPPNDPLFGASWHLANTGQAGGTAGVDIKVLSAWRHYTGRNVLVGVLDDGVELTHPDLAANAYIRPAGVTLVDAANANLTIGAPQAGDNHGTSAAGVIAAVGNNGLGGDGVAPGAKIASYRVLGTGNASTAQAFQQSLNDGAQVTNNSYGTDTAFNNPGTALLDMLAAAATTGRGGLGAITVFANGNERGSLVSGNDLTGTDGGLDAATANRFTIAVAAIENTGVITSYSTRGSNLLIAAPGGTGDPNLTQGTGITTIDRTGTAGYNTQDGAAGDYTGFNGTSAAAPVIAGVAALILEARPGLGYRDVQEILAYTARQIDPAAGTAGNTSMNRTAWLDTAAGNANGGGLKYSTDYGFGLVDAGAAVRLAESWTPVRTEANLITATAAAAGVGVITAGGVATVQSFTTTFSMAQPGGAHAGFRVNRVELDLGITAPRAQDLTITLTSVGGTTITMARTPGNAFTPTGAGAYDGAQPLSWPAAGFTLDTPGFWGESAVGTWTLTVSASANAASASSLTSATLRVYGDSSAGGAPDLRSQLIITDDYARLAGLQGSRATLGGNGATALNAAPTSSDATIDLRSTDGGGGGTTTIAGQAVTLTGSSLRDAFGGAGNDAIIGGASANLLNGGWGNDVLLGGAGDDTLQGGFDNDVLDGGAGQDSLVGGQGDDTYVVDSQGDAVAEQTLQGTDTAFVTVSGWTVAANLEIVRLYGNAAAITGSAGADVIVANAGVTSTINAGDGDDTLWGSALGHFLGGGGGDDIIRGQNGAATMAGGTGNDQYVVGHLGAQVQENANEGIDTVYLAVNGWTNPAHVEIVRLSAPGVVLVHGNDGNEDLVANQAEASTLNGNGGDDTLWGSGLADTLNGGAGNDILRGQGGADSYSGGLGNDQFVVFSAGATIIENAGEGYDIVYFDGAGILSIGDHVEEARLFGAGTGLTGNADANLIVGNSSGLASFLDGGAGNDVIFGTAAADTIIGGAGNDTLYSQGGADIFRFGAQWGYDQIAGFTAGAAKLQFLAASGVTSFAQLSLASGGGNTQVEFGGYAVLVFGVGALTASDFLFA